MIAETRIMLLCNNEMAVPAMQQLFLSGSLRAVVVPDQNRSLLAMLRQAFTGSPIKLVSANKKNLQHTVSSLIKDERITAVMLMTFPYLIPPSLLKLLPGAFFNFHYGLLPQYRGANPVLAQMLEGEQESGITVHIVDEGIDTGPMLMQQRIRIEDTDTFGTQMQKLASLGASMAVAMLHILRTGVVPPAIPQDSSKTAYYKRPAAPDLMINWRTMTSHQVLRLINACNPWNKGAGTMIRQMGICLLHAELTGSTVMDNIVPGTITLLDKAEGCKIYCKDHTEIRINVISIPEGFYPASKLMDLGIKKGDQFLSMD